MPTQSQQIEALIAKLEPALAAAFREAMQEWRDGVNRPALIRALERGDIEAAIAALNIDPAVFNQYQQERINGFAASGQLIASFLRGPMSRIPGTDGSPIQFRFDMTNPRAEAVIREQAATRIAGYTQEQTETARRVIVEGYARGDGPQNIAVDIAGRINRVTGRREGGIIGLSDPQASYVQNMQERLLSGDPAEMRKVLQGQTLRDKRFDRTIERAIREGRPVPRAQVEKMTGRYSDRLLARRAEDIARTETAQSVETARAESYRQAIAKAGLNPDKAIVKTWRHSGGIEDARMQHLIMHDISVTGLDTPFIMPDGTPMQHSHDPEGGAKHNVNCRCQTIYEIDFSRGVV